MKNTNIKYLGFDDFKFMFIGILLLGFFIPQVFFGVRINEYGYHFFSSWFEASLYSIFFWLTNRYIMIFYRKKYTSFKKSKKRILLALITAIICLPITSIISEFLIVRVLDLLRIDELHQPTPLEGFGSATTATFLILAIYESIWYYSQLKKTIQEQEQEKSALLHSQLEGLRNQVNPHFLFNSLNTLNHIVEFEDKSVAKNFIGQLSKVYRYVLESREDATIILEEELNFLKSYVAIQKERFLTNLIVNIDIPVKYLHAKIIPLSLQLLVENAIKHNVISSKMPLTISIKIDEEERQITVSNNLQKNQSLRVQQK